METITALALIAVIFSTLVALYWFASRKPSHAPKNNLNTQIQQVEDESKPLVRILFGSQTGTSEMYARALAKEGKNWFRTKCEDLLEYNKENITDDKILIFVVATYGEGEPTDSSKEFYDWFAEQSSFSLDLSGTLFTVFGLGDKQYKHFCQIGKITDKKMNELGATKVHDLGEGDADHTLEEDFDNWRSAMWPKLCEAAGVEFHEVVKETWEPNTQLRVLNTTLPADWKPFPDAGKSIPEPKRLVYCPVTANKELLQNTNERSTMHMEIDISNTNVRYESGDHLAIHAPNRDEQVDEYLKYIDMSPHTPDTVISLNSLQDGQNTLPCRCTIRNALRWYLDLNATPKKDVLKLWVTCCQDETEKENIRKLLANNDEAKLAYKKLMEKLRNPFGFLRKYTNCKVPIALFLETMPKLQPRYYSIASDPKGTPGSIHICYALMPAGLCTPHLKAMSPGDKVALFVRRSTFHIPANPSVPLVLIGPGTGIAPLIGFLWRRRALKEKDGKDLGPCDFYFGCRHKDEDFLYECFLRECEQLGVISTLHTAFSREQLQKVYVQHVIQRTADRVLHLLHEQQGKLYICGDARNMARDVETTFKQILQTSVSELATTEAVEEYVGKMESGGRYLKDVWSVHN